jgi:hypothetical protein
MGLCITGLLCTDIPGDTARRLNEVGSRSSSRRRLLFILRVISAAVGMGWGVVGGAGDVDRGCVSCGSSDGETKPAPYSEDDMAERDGEPIATSSLIPEDDARGRNVGGGGVRCWSSGKVSQKSFPLELRIACCLKLLDSPLSVDGVDEESAIKSSSGMSSRGSARAGSMLGEDCAVDEIGAEACLVGSRSISLSRTCLTTAASRRTSVSIGALSSASAARMRAKPFVLGYLMSAIAQTGLR